MALPSPMSWSFDHAVISECEASKALLKTSPMFAEDHSFARYNAISWSNGNSRSSRYVNDDVVFMSVAPAAPQAGLLGDPIFVAAFRPPARKSGMPIASRIRPLKFQS